MAKYVVHRLMLFPLVLLAVSLITFALVRALPGDAAVARLGANTSRCDECYAKVRHDLGLDRSKPEQYWMWVKGAVHLDFGLSTSTGQDISPELGSRFLNTLRLGLLTIALTLLIGVPVGAVSAVKSGSMADYVLRFFSILGLSVPSFWVATLVIFMPLIWWGWTPLRDFVEFEDNPIEHLEVLLLPAAILAIAGSAYVARITRSAVLETLSSDFVRTARAKGLRDGAVVFRHVLRNSMLTLLTVIGLQFGVVLGGSVIMETIFSIPGMGSWLVMAVSNRDYQVVQASAVVFAFWFLSITLLTDLLYAWADPRVRY